MGTLVICQICFCYKKFHPRGEWPQEMAYEKATGLGMRSGSGLSSSTGQLDGLWLPLPEHSAGTGEKHF